MTSTAICGSDLHLYGVLGAFLDAGDVLGHEAMGVDLQSQCETTQVTAEGSGAALFGYTKLYGQVPGGQAEYLRVPQAQYGPVVVPDDGTPDERYLCLSDVLPTAWQAVEYAEVAEGGTGGARSRADRPDGRPDSRAPGCRARRGRGPGARAAGHGGQARHHRPRLGPDAVRMR